MIKSKLDDGVEEVELDNTTPEDLVGCSYSLPIVDYVKCPNCNTVVPNMTEDEYEITDEWEDEGGNTDSYGEYTGRKEFTCPNCNKTYRWYDENPLGIILTDDLQDIPNIDEIVPNYMEVYNAVYKIYEEHGEKGLLKNLKSSYSGEFKQSVIEYMHKNHLSCTETAIHFNLGNNYIVSKWERIYYEEGPQALYEERRGRKKNMSSKPRKKKLSKEIEEDLIAENQRLRMENAYLKKLQALVQERTKPKQEKK